MNLFQCDFCVAGPVKSLNNYSLPPAGWHSVRMQADNSDQITMHACPKCYKRLGFEEVSRATPEEEMRGLLANMMFEIIQDEREG